MAQGSSAAEKLQHLRRCERLTARIDNHEVQLQEIIQEAIEPLPLIELIDNVGNGSYWDELEDDANSSTSRDAVPGLDADRASTRDANGGRHAVVQDIDEEYIPPYDVKITLPSTMSAEHRRDRGLDVLVESELELRRGQAEDALYQLRVTLGYKSLLYRKGIRTATGSKQRTRAFGEMETIGRKLRVICRLYDVARDSMLSLTDPGSVIGVEVRSRYRLLTKDDLKVSTEYLSNDIRGQRNRAQSWIWALDAGRDASNNQWLEECEWFHSGVICLELTIIPRSTCELVQGKKP